MAIQFPIPKVPWRQFVASQQALARDMVGTLMGYRQQLGDFYRIYFGFKPIHVAADPGLVRHVLQGNYKNYRKSRAYRVIGEMIGNGLLTSEGDFWLRQRRLIQPAFHRRKLEGLSGIMVEQTRHFIDELSSRSGEVDMHREMMQLTLRVVMRSLFSSGIDGIDLDRFDKAFKALQDDLILRFRLPFHRFFSYFNGKARNLRKEEELINQIIWDLIRSRLVSGEDKEDLLGMLIGSVDAESGERLSEQQLRDEALVLFLAGHETSANALTWLWYLLSQHPEVEQKLVEEVEEVLGDREITFADIKSLVYTEQVINETLRCYPPAYVTGREAIADDEYEGIALPKGTTVNVFFYGLHHHPDLWQDPERFDPERFAPDRIDAIPAYAFLPFGGGPRICIGNQFAMIEMKIAVALMVREFRMHYARTKPPGLDPLITLRPRDGMPMRIEKKNILVS